MGTYVHRADAASWGADGDVDSIDQNRIRVNVIPTRNREDENAALCAPLSFSGTPEEVDGEMARSLGVLSLAKIAIYR
jgi:PRTRC genetic system protein E